MHLNMCSLRIFEDTFLIGAAIIVCSRRRERSLHISLELLKSTLIENIVVFFFFFFFFFFSNLSLKDVL